LLSATLSVDPASTSPGVYHTIQAAVNAAPSGATIKVAPGLYNEDVTISKSLTLLGGQPILRGEKGPSTLEYETTGFTVASANKVTIKGFTIEADPASMTSTEDAINASNTTGSAFENNLIVGSFIFVGPGVTHTEVANNSDPSSSFFDIQVSGNSAGADADDTFLDNTLYNGGISLDNSATGALLQGNKAFAGPQIENSADNVTFIDNTSDDADEGFIDTGNNDTFIGNVADNNASGFGLGGGGKLTLSGNVANNNDGDGFFIFGSSTLTMKGNTANGNTGNGDGFDISGVTSATLTSNTANNNADAGFSVSTNSPTLTGNTASDNADYGFIVGGGSPKVSNDTTSGGQVGFAVDGASPSVTNCTATNAQFFGFETASSGPVTISGNTAKNDGATGFGFSLAIGGGTVCNNTSNNDGTGFSIASAGTLNFSSNQADNNASTGIAMNLQQGTISGNTANANAGYGFEIESTAAASILHNTADNNGGAGMSIQMPGGTVSYNTADGNQGGGNNLEAGFLLFGAGMSITNNTARNNTYDGFLLFSVSSSTFSGNTSDGNHGDGIHLISSYLNTLSHNTADSNRNDGIDLDVISISNTVSNNTALGNSVDDLFDASTGSGTAGTANTWTRNTAHTRSPAGLQ
jgi:parallel beta-helix repeat protein